MNGYVRLSAVKSYLQVTGTKLDDEYGVQLDEVSAEFASECDRRFQCESAVKVFPGSGCALLLFEDDLVSASAVKVDLDLDGTYETALTVDTDYWLWPLNRHAHEPYRGIQLNPISSLLRHWPEFPRVLQVTGLWGYSNETESTTLTLNDDGGGLDASETSITTSANPSALVDVGETIVIDSEQMYVAAVSATALTVTRAINGTTAATHTNGATIYRRRYPRDVEQAVRGRVAAMRWDASGESPITGDGLASANLPGGRAAYARWRAAVERYSVPRVS